MIVQSCTMIIVHACSMIIVCACTMIILHACTMINVYACIMIIVHACPMIVVHACTMIRVYACTIIRTPTKIPKEIRMGKRFLNQIPRGGAKSRDSIHVKSFSNKKRLDKWPMRQRSKKANQRCNPWRVLCHEEMHASELQVR